MSLFSFPTIRLTYPTLGNPVYVSDIKAANDLALDGLTVLTGLPNPGFAILDGFDYAGGQYQPGVIWFNGFFYSVPYVFTEGLFVLPTVTPILSKPFSDTNSKNIYAQYIAVPTANPAGATPQFAGNMNGYRISLTELKQEITVIQAQLLSLGTAAFANIGNTANTVAAGDDPRLVGTLSFFDNRYAQSLNVILKNTVSGAYVPALPGDPVNKAYADQSIRKLASGTQHLGNIPGGAGQVFTIPLGANVGTVNYLIKPMLLSGAANPYDDCSVFFVFKNRTAISFDMYVFEARGDNQDLTLVWSIEAL